MQFGDFEPFFIVPAKGEAPEMTCSSGEFVNMCFRLDSKQLTGVVSLDSSKRYLKLLALKENGGDLTKEAIREATDGADSTFLRNNIKGFVKTIIKDDSVSSKLRIKNTNLPLLLLEEYTSEASRTHTSEVSRIHHGKKPIALSSFTKKFGKQYSCNKELCKYLLRSKWPPMQQQIPRYTIYTSGFLQKIFVHREGYVESLQTNHVTNPMKCRNEILSDDTFQFPEAFVFSEMDVVTHGSQLLLDNLLSGPAAEKPIGSAVVTTTSCCAAIMFHLDERYEVDFLEQADATDNPGMPALGLDKQYIVTITLGEKEVEIGVKFKNASAAEQMMTALLIAAAKAKIPEATMIQIDGPNTEFPSGLSCCLGAWSSFMKAYPANNTTTLRFVFLNFIEEQSLPLAMSCNPLIFDRCSFQNNGTDFAQIDKLCPDKHIKVRVSFKTAINFNGKTDSLLNNLACAVNNGTMAYLYFEDISLESQDELDALRNLCRAAIGKGWQVLLAEAIDFNQNHYLVLCDVEYKKDRNYRRVHEYCTAGVE